MSEQRPEAVPPGRPEASHDGLEQPDDDIASCQDGFGDPRVDEAIAGLDAVAEAPAAEQVAAFESAHRVLQDTLAAVDEA